ncbi:E3 ubiquitin-protein ligase TRIM47-like [Archocentrus centrarchus]|uniref:E3 ubiquitin-protein ligase TRIM47-like n=1 Tax=Archocentrus centrarchus TaxID=63155 RepID=UPI0011EA3C00|nr:E3 ubiquitin-protein ligase TRIM47-like [Archocentrus centrarchus]
MSDPPECCICLDELTRPVSLPCAHVFCLGCIGEYWKISEACQCPLCKAFFPTRPPLKTDQTLQTVEAAVPLKAGEVPCDSCPTKCPAVKSCLVCMASYCATHLEAHYQSEELGRHLLVSVVKNLEDSVCKLHGKKLERFCRSDRALICAMCAQTEHRSHHIIPISLEASKTKVRLKRRGTKLQQRIQERLSKTEKIKLTADLSGESPKVSRQRNKELKQLEEEIAELRSRNAELEQLLEIEDSLHFLQRSVQAAL